jgi:tRNA uridine 5-carbamoylmethylation protein Kti12
MNIVVISGSPGSGKTSFARLLSSRDARGVHIESDIFFRFLSHRLDPSSVEAQEQNEAVVRAYLAAAAEYVAGGYKVYLDGVIGPWLFPLITPSFPRFDYVLLRASLQEVLARAESRGTQPSASPEVVKRMHEQFADTIVAFPRHVIDTEGKSIAEAADEFLSRGADGAFVY